MAARRWDICIYVCVYVYIYIYIYIYNIHNIDVYSFRVKGLWRAHKERPRICGGAGRAWGDTEVAKRHAMRFEGFRAYPLFGFCTNSSLSSNSGQQNLSQQYPPSWRGVHGGRRTCGGIQDDAGARGLPRQEHSNSSLIYVWLVKHNELYAIQQHNEYIGIIDKLTIIEREFEYICMYIYIYIYMYIIEVWGL